MGEDEVMQIGDRVRDQINGFTGIATGKTLYVNGCVQFLVKPESLDKDGKVQDGIWIDQQHLGVVDKQVVADPFTDGEAPTAGGPDRRERSVS